MYMQNLSDLWNSDSLHLQGEWREWEVEHMDIVDSYVHLEGLLQW